MIRFRYLMLPLLVIGVEAGVQWWRHAEPAPHGPVFFWRGAALATRGDSAFNKALALYEADRGAREVNPLEGAKRLEVLYFEWDDVEAGPLAVFTGHESEVCNVAAGFRFGHTGSVRIHRFDEGEPMHFRHTFLTSPEGLPVHAYKAVWLQGGGDWHASSSLDRGLRLKRSFIRLRGAARVLQAGVFGVQDEPAAWEIFEREVLSNVEWVKESGKPKAES